MKLVFVENRNHVWSDLSRLVDVECNMPQTGLCVVRGEQEPCVE